MRRSAFGLLLVFVLGLTASGGHSSADRFRRMSAEELSAVFEAAEPGSPPVGELRGKVVAVTGRLPRVRAGLMNAVWKGKDAHADGTFVNRWAGGVRAISNTYTLGDSLLDGRPAWCIQYPADVPILGNTRDELREVCPGVYVGPLYDRLPCARLKGFLVLECR